MRRKERERPAVLTGRAALHGGLHQALARLLRLALLLRIDLGEVARVRVTEDRDAHVRLLDRPRRGGRDPFELLVIGELIERGRRSLRRQLHHGESAGPQDLLVYRLSERLGGGGGLEHHGLALLHLRGVVDENLC